MRAAGRPPGFAALLAADALASLAELAAAVVIPWWITTQGGMQAIAAYGMTLAVATLIVVPAAAPFGDRFCKAAQMGWGLAGLASTAFALAWCAARPFALAPVLGLSVARVLARTFVEPAQSALLPELVAMERLPAAIKLQKTCRAVSGVLGPLLAGALLGLANVPVALAACAALPLVAAAASLAIPRHPGGAQAFDARAWWRDLRAGARAKWTVPMERGWTLVNFVVWIFQGPAVGILIPIKVNALGLAGQWLGAGLGALALGVLIGSLCGTDRLVRRFGRYRVRIGLGCIEGLCLAGVGLAPSAAPMLAGLVFAGFCNATMALVGATHRALAIPRSHRVRMLAAGAVSTQVAGAAGPALVGIALAHWAVPAVYAGCGLLMAVSVLGLCRVPRLREFLELDHAHVVDWYPRQYPRVFPGGAGQAPPFMNAPTASSAG
ncbi:MFS transporter [Roseateles saccharophilus]|uniref:MFS transporter n=1 Tax=Roseateles saccharophilus TaxID=304 RepID=A0A4R3VI04_ROSSA|nr:MFS transporter [Roseateles saccharophilus]MDG0834793.1 MFS transporter [Roseateles saccharophilus]TCV03388.1 MFS transporter [Roseateles saccharophilus]